MKCIIVALSLIVTAVLGRGKSQNSYIIQLKTRGKGNFSKRADPEMDLEWVKDILKKNDGKGRTLDGSSDRDNIITYQFSFGSALQAFSVRSTEEAFNEIKADSRVESAVVDKRFKLDRFSYAFLWLKSWMFSLRRTWGIDRIDQRSLPLDGQYNDASSNQGEGVTIYIVDTGINIKHASFQGRAEYGPNFSGSVENWNSNDQEGHGTHCAGIAASKDYGVAKKAKVVGIKVFGDDGYASTSAMLAAYSWIFNNAVRGKSVVSLSLGYQMQPCNPSQSCPKDIQHLAVAALVSQGKIPVVAAAGNNNGNACDFSPGGEPLAFTVGATDKNDNMASYSNWGKCIDMFAPGTKIRSTWKKYQKWTRVLSGTSMATPHVAGAFALLLSDKNYPNVEDLYNDLISRSTQYVVNGAVNSPNRLLYVGS